MATRVCKLNSFSDKTQRWKLDGTVLKNKEGVWKSDDLWNFKNGSQNKDDGLIYIENNSKTKVLQATSDGKVIQEVFVEGKAKQLWKKGKPDAEDYFTLESHSKVPKVITAISESDLEIKKTIVLVTTNDSKVILENFEDDKAEQLWEKGEPNAEEYFTLENYEVAKFMTYVISSSSLEIKGNMNLMYVNR